MAAGFAPSLLNVVAEMGSTEAVREAVKARIGDIHNLFVRGEGGYRKKQPICGSSKRDLYSQAVFSGPEKESRLSPLCSAFLEHLRSEEE